MVKYWIKKLKNDPVYGTIRFKKLETGYPPFDIDDDLIDTVDMDEFLRIEQDRIPLFIGSQFGIHPKIREIRHFFNGKKRWAILSKSLLSGMVSGLSIYQIEQNAKFNLPELNKFLVERFNNY